MPTFIRPTRLPAAGGFHYRAECPDCGRRGDTEAGAARSAAAGRRSAAAELSLVCACRSAGRQFLADDTPDGLTLWLDALGGLKRLHLCRGVVYSPVGPYEPGGAVPLIACTEAAPPGKGDPLRERWVDRLAAVTDRLRRKGYYVRVAHGRPDKLRGDTLAPLPPLRRQKAEAPA